MIAYNLNRAIRFSAFPEDNETIAVKIVYPPYAAPPTWYFKLEGTSTKEELGEICKEIVKEISEVWYDSIVVDLVHLISKHGKKIKEIVHF